MLDFEDCPCKLIENGDILTSATPVHWTSIFRWSRMMAAVVYSYGIPAANLDLAADQQMDEPSGIKFQSQNIGLRLASTDLPASNSRVGSMIGRLFACFEY
jgi:hypothetical protein